MGKGNKRNKRQDLTLEETLVISTYYFILFDEIIAAIAEFILDQENQENRSRPGKPGNITRRFVKKSQKAIFKLKNRKFYILVKHLFNQ